ncbi:MAG: 50S ribosomal protein L9 [Nitrospirae bacterium]|nr:50S ribosomal protein L9 [Nitrospirota bacterium]
MKVILKSDVKDLGDAGVVVSVKDGFARNYLIPKNLAVEANEKNIKALEHERKKILEAARKVKAGAEDLASKISALSVTINAKAGDEDKLFGSVTSMDIADALKLQGVDIDKKKIVLDEPIKRLGAYTIPVKIHSSVSAQLNVVVTGE